MPNNQYEQHNFSVGEVDPKRAWNVDAIRTHSVRSARNMRPRISGALDGREGSTWIGDAAGDGILAVMTVDDSTYKLVFTAGAVAIWDKQSRTLVQTLSGCAWTGAQLQHMVVSPYGSSAYVSHATLATQVVTRADDGAWSVAGLSFDAGVGGSVRQPYYRYAAKGVTCQPSDSTPGASIELKVFNADGTNAVYWVAGHVGTRIRLQQRECLVTAVSDTHTAIATVMQKLYETRTIPVASTTGFEVGEIIEGRDSAAKGEITAVTSSTALSVLMQSFTEFAWTAADGDTPAAGEEIIGLNATTTLTATPGQITDAPVLDWDEQAISPLRGYPATCAVHRSRLWLARLPLVPFAIMASAIGSYEDFQVGTNDDDAIFELLGDEGAGRIEHIVSAEQLVVMSSRSVYYYPESEQNPISPTGFELLRVGPDGAGTCRPVVTSDGVLYAGSGGGSILGAFGTGDLRRSWRTANLSKLAPHLISTARSIAFVGGAPHVAERSALVAMTTGDLAVLTYDSDDANAQPGWAPWDSLSGAYRSLAAVDGECWALVRRRLGSAVAYSLEVFEADRVMDATRDIDPSALQGAADGESIDTPDGLQAAALVYRCAGLAGATVGLMVGGSYIGDVTLSAAGDFGTPDMAGDISLGFRFPSQCVPWFPLDEQDQRARRRKRRLIRTHVRWQGRYLECDGTMRPIYDGTDDSNAAPPLRDELWAAPGFGWSDEPAPTITRRYPGPLSILGLSMEVAS